MNFGTRPFFSSSPHPERQPVRPDRDVPDGPGATGSAFGWMLDDPNTSGRQFREGTPYTSQNLWDERHRHATPYTHSDGSHNSFKTRKNSQNPFGADPPIYSSRQKPPAFPGRMAPPAPLGPPPPPPPPPSFEEWMAQRDAAKAKKPPFTGHSTPVD